MDAPSGASAAPMQKSSPAASQVAANERGVAVDLKVPIVIHDELSERVIDSTGSLDLASGEIRNVQYADYDVAVFRPPPLGEGNGFTYGTFFKNGQDLAFYVAVDILTSRSSASGHQFVVVKNRD